MTEFETRPSEDIEPPKFPEMRRRGFFDDLPTGRDFFTEPAAEPVTADHAERARNLLMTAESHAFAGEQDRLVAKAHVHATLALVEQQRLANLIAWQLGTAENYEREIREGLTR